LADDRLVERLTTTSSTSSSSGGASRSSTTQTPPAATGLGFQSMRVGTAFRQAPTVGGSGPAQARVVWMSTLDAFTSGF